MTIHDLVQAAYPGADPTADYRVQDDGNGAYLAAWRIAGPLPAGVTLMAQQTAAQWFEVHHGELRAAAQELITKIDRIHTGLAANPQIAAAAQAAEAGAVIAGTGMVKEEVLMGIALIGVFRAFIETEVATGITVRSAVYRLG